MRRSAADSLQQAPRNPLVRFAVSVIVACTAVVILFTVCGFAARIWWRFEQLCHFRVQYFWLLGFSAAVLVVSGRRRLAVIAGIASAVNLAMIVPIYLPARHAGNSPPVASPPLEIVSFNVHGKNQEYEQVAAWLRSESADMVLLMEVQPHWLPALESLRDLYPHQKVVSRRDNFGIALLSKTRWRYVRTEEFGTAELPSILVAFDHGGQTVTLVGTHPLPPGSASAAAARNEQLAAIGEFVRQHPGPILVAGDLNLTEHSPYFGDLLRVAELHDSRQGIGIQASWAARLPGLDLPLDHVLVSREWRVHSRRIGPHLGSDHRPVVASIGCLQSKAQ